MFPRRTGGQSARKQREAMGSTATIKTTRGEPGPERRWAVVVVAVIGVGLVAAPFAFGMFSKAPKGAAYLDAAGADPRGFDAAHPGFASFDAQWPAIDSKMTGLMDQVQGNLE